MAITDLQLPFLGLYEVAQSPVDRYGIATDRLVAGNQRQVVGQRLGDEDAVEWIAMVIGKRLQRG